MKIKVQNKNYGLTELYTLVAKEYIRKTFNGDVVAVDFSEYEFDCRCINVAPNIQDGFYRSYMKILEETTPTMSKVDMRMGITMLLAMNGPKVDTNLDYDEVEVFDGFIVEERK